ncbi:glycosyltransferase family 4 protein [Pedobacter sp. UBA5917]|jgi:glycosyltransferase involved in cell wall biosynthesis|uniref:glycosyltransferase family 4 protein n=1 Tax=Pedobacter sp. UBA5917 TaxID=1947061 RepID=UPI0025EF307F|nr:glycosyltransferase family 4 protein [Pedobacter sp. UBA5917]
MPKRILFLTLYTYSLTGGIEKVCKNFIQILHSLAQQGKIEDSLSLSLYDQNQQHHKYSCFNGNKIKYLLNTFRKSFSYDVIILSHIHLLPIAKLIRQFSPKKKIILFAHGIEVWKPLSSWKKKLLSEIDTWAVSAYTAKKINELNGIPLQNIHILNNSLAKDYPFNEEKIGHSITTKYHIPADHQILLTVCRLSSSEQYKGYDKVLSALKDLVKNYPKLSYLIVGKADEAELTRIQELVFNYQLEQHVVLTGYVSDTEIENLYNQADVFAMPSKGEGFGLVFTEALAHGCRVLAGNADGSSDALLNGELGLLVNPEDTEAIYKGIKTLLSEPVQEDEATKRKEKVKAYFGFDAYVSKVAHLLGF